MIRLEKHYNNIIAQDLLLKNNYKNFFQLAKIEKITLNIGLINSFLDKKKIISLILLLELISNNKSIITKSKKNKIILKIKKGTIVGCKTILRKKLFFNFFEKIFLFQIPFLKDLKDFKGFKINKKNKNVLDYKISNVLNHIEIENEFLKFQNIPSLDITIHFKSKTNIENLQLLNSYNLPTIS